MRPRPFALLVVLAVFSSLSACGGAGPSRTAASLPAATRSGPAGPPTGAATMPSTAPTPAPPAPQSAPAATANAEPPLAGCPPPPPPPRPPFAPWHPAVLVPESALPAAPAPAGAPVLPITITGKGLWIWQFSSTENGDAAAIVARAVSTGLRQLWVRVADSRDGFYNAAVLDRLVPLAHRQGIAVIAWGFPYLYDPVRDSRWSSAVLAWRSPGGDAVDGFSPDIETASEGVALSDRRVAVYLGLLRAATPGRLIVATVYRPTDYWWMEIGYPFTTIARYVDAFAPMVYWGCTEPGAAAEQAISRLAALRPVHVIGQAYNMAEDGGRPASPSAAELERFLEVAQRSGAVGASFWVWQTMDGEEWSAVRDFTWSAVPGGIR